MFRNSQRAVHGLDGDKATALNINSLKHTTVLPAPDFFDKGVMVNVEEANLVHRPTCYMNRGFHDRVSGDGGKGSRGIVELFRTRCG